MDSLGLPTPRATDDCSPRRPTIFYRWLTRRTIYDTPSTVAEILSLFTIDLHSYLTRGDHYALLTEQST
jgi:hypothetical protein